MEFSWTTFFFEIINFLVLVWILQRFLYKPVMKVIAQRKANIEGRMEEAKAIQSAAQELQRQYENRMADWEKEKDKARTQLLDEFATERARLMAELLKSLEQERERNRVLEQKYAIELRKKMEQESCATASRFAALLLSRIASAQLEDSIRELMIEDLSHLTQDKIQSLRQACEDTDTPLKVTSAYPVDNDARAAITRALASLIAKPVVCNFVRNPDLLAGFHVSVGFWALDCNLKDGLNFFAEAARRAG